ncbi:hypothetical protein GCM10007863_37340 [Dyella mobilis]|nr:hypothetical protein GCM10007863_37340 [Dyella mobilis]
MCGWQNVGRLFLAKGLTCDTPFGAAGARDLSQAVKELSAMPRGAKAIVSVCADGRQSVVELLENSP